MSVGTNILSNFVMFAFPSNLKAKIASGNVMFLIFRYLVSNVALYSHIACSVIVNIKSSNFSGQTARSLFSNVSRML